MRRPLPYVLRDGLRDGARPYARGISLLALTTALALSIPWFLRRAVDGLRAGTSLRQVGILAGTIAGAALLQTLVRTASRVVVLGYSRKAVAAVRERLQAHLLDLPASFFDRARVGDLMSRAVNDLRSLRNFFGPGVLNVANTFLMSGAALGMMLWINVPLTGAALIACPLFVVLARRTVRQIHWRSRRAQEQLADLTSRVEQSVMGHLQIKVFSQEEREMRAFAALSEAYRQANLDLARAEGRMAPLVGLLGGLGALAVLGLGGWQVARGAMTLGDFVAFNVLLGQLSGPLIMLGWTFDLFQRGQAAALRIQEILEETPIQEPRAPRVARPARGALELRGLEFQYGSNHRGPVLGGVSLSVAPGERLGIVGAVGSGKSTLLALVAGLYPPTAGSILLDGIPISDWPREELRRVVALAPQDAFLFSRSLADNIRLGKPDLSRAEVEEWLRRVAFERDLEAFPNGVDTLVGERGLSVSGGQRQRAALARTLAVDARVLLLDDPLSMVDPETESRILDSLDAVLRDRTVLLCTHRTGLLARMDRIVVLEGGHIVEQGTHEELLGRDGAYARLALESRIQGQTGTVETRAGGSP